MHLAAYVVIFVFLLFLYVSIPLINLIDVIKDKDVDLFDDLDLKNNISLLLWMDKLI